MARRPRSVTARMTVTHLRRVSPPHEGFAPSGPDHAGRRRRTPPGLYAASGPRSDMLDDHADDSATPESTPTAEAAAPAVAKTARKRTTKKAPGGSTEGPPADDAPAGGDADTQAPKKAAPKKAAAKNAATKRTAAKKTTTKKAAATAPEDAVDDSATRDTP